MGMNICLLCFLFTQRSRVNHHHQQEKKMVPLSPALVVFRLIELTGADMAEILSLFKRVCVNIVVLVPDAPWVLVAVAAIIFAMWLVLTGIFYLIGQAWGIMKAAFYSGEMAVTSSSPPATTNVTEIAK